MRPRRMELLVTGQNIKIIRKEETYEDILKDFCNESFNVWWLKNKKKKIESKILMFPVFKPKLRIIFHRWMSYMGYYMRIYCLKNSENWT